jgi:hypothetical protein
VLQTSLIRRCAAVGCGIAANPRRLNSVSGIMGLVVDVWMQCIFVL